MLLRVSSFETDIEYVEELLCRWLLQLFRSEGLPIVLICQKLSDIGYQAGRHRAHCLLTAMIFLIEDTWNAVFEQYCVNTCVYFDVIVVYIYH